MITDNYVFTTESEREIFETKRNIFNPYRPTYDDYEHHDTSFYYNQKNSDEFVSDYNYLQDEPIEFDEEGKYGMSYINKDTLMMISIIHRLVYDNIKLAVISELVSFCYEYAHIKKWDKFFNDWDINIGIPYVQNIINEKFENFPIFLHDEIERKTGFDIYNLRNQIELLQRINFDHLINPYFPVSYSKEEFFEF